jgi:hypothetical protein
LVDRLQRFVAAACQPKKVMRILFYLLTICMVCLLLPACKKNSTAAKNGCDPLAITSRKIVAKKATVKLTATATYPVYLVEEGSIDTKLIPCNFPAGPEYNQNDLQVTITGDVKPVAAIDYGPCCSENLVITSIAK